jgi:uncharacterized protein YndB with AHSA1/START domain
MTEYPYDIELIRVFDAPPERVYQAFTDPDQFARWDGPVGFPVHHDHGRTRLVVGEGPHPPGTADLSRQAWEMMLPRLESLLSG